MSTQIARAMDAHFERLAKYHRVLLGIRSGEEEPNELVRQGFPMKAAVPDWRIYERVATCFEIGAERTWLIEKDVLGQRDRSARHKFASSSLRSRPRLAEIPPPHANKLYPWSIRHGTSGRDIAGRVVIGRLDGEALQSHCRRCYLTTKTAV